MCGCLLLEFFSVRGVSWGISIARAVHGCGYLWICQSIPTTLFLCKCGLWIRLKVTQSVKLSSRNMYIVSYRSGWSVLITGTRFFSLLRYVILPGGVNKIKNSQTLPR